MSNSPKDLGRAGQFSGRAIAQRQDTELVGICRGLIADEHLNDAEIEFLHRWLVANTEAKSNPVLDLLLTRIHEMFADGYVNEDERSDLADLLGQLARNDFEVGELLKPTSLPLTRPAPPVTFAGRTFCFTGTFMFGKRAACESAAIDRGGRCVSAVSRGTSFLVIGEYSSPAWQNSSFGRKIEAAVAARAEGAPVAIVSEAHWRTFL